MNEARLKCNVSKGMFPGEAAVSFEATTGELICLFCFKDFVDAQHGRLSVKIVGQDENHVLVRLPVESLNGFRVVPVRKQELDKDLASELPVAG